MTLQSGRASAIPARVPAELVRRLIWAALILVGLLFAIMVGAGAFMTYKITTTHSDIENVTPSSYLLPSYVSLEFTDANGGKHDGWLLVGLKGAPAVILCPGYGLNRADLLSLGVVLQANHFNVYLFNFSGPRTRETFSNLGVREASDVQSAIAMVTHHEGVNPNRVGLYGVTVGGYAAIVAAEKNPQVKALAVDNIYEDPRQMFNVELDHLLGGTGPLFRNISDAEFALVNLLTKVPQVRADLPKLADRPKLFLAAEDLPHLKATTEDLYHAAPQPKRLLLMDHSPGNMASDFEKKEYENQILNFFLQNLPLRAD